MMFSTNFSTISDFQLKTKVRLSTVNFLLVKAQSNTYSTIVFGLVFDADLTSDVHERIY